MSGMTRERSRIWAGTPNAAPRWDLPSNSSKDITTLDFSCLEVPSTSFSVTCGVLGMSHIFDAVVSGESEAVAVARFVKGIALNAFNFSGRPEVLYLSGGLCDNPLFVRSFPCKIIPLGRFVLLEGLKAITQSSK